MKFINDQLSFPDVSLTTQSTAIYAALLLHVSAQIVSTGAPTATYKIQASNDKGDPVNNFVPSHWFDIPSATVTLVGAGTVAIPKTDLAYNWIRISQTGGGTGTATVNVFGIGA